MAKHTDAENENFFREVQEELRREKIKQFWDKHGNLILGIAIAVVLIVACMEGWTVWRRYVSTQDSQAFVQASQLLENGEKEEAADAFLRLSQDAGTDYRYLALLNHASILIDTGKKDEGMSELRTFAHGTNGPLPLRRLAMAALSYYEMDSASADQVKQDLTPLLSDTKNPWHGIALRNYALSLVKEGRKEEAKTMLSDILAAPETPSALREEVSVLIGSVDFLTDGAKTPKK